MVTQETLSFYDFNHAIHVSGDEARWVGKVVRALAVHECCPGSTPYVGWVCCFSTLLRKFFSGTLVSPSDHQKPTFDLICCDSLWFVVSSISEALCSAKSIETLIKWLLLSLVLLSLKTRSQDAFFKLVLFPFLRGGVGHCPEAELTPNFTPVPRAKRKIRRF